MTQEGSSEDLPEMSFAELDLALEDETHPRHNEAKRIMRDTVQPTIKRISSSLMPKLPSNGFASLRLPTRVVDPIRFQPPRSGLHENMAAAQAQVDDMIESFQAERARKEAAAAEERAAEMAQREADRREARRQHRVMLGWTIASVGIAFIAAVIAVVALFVSGSGS